MGLTYEDLLIESSSINVDVKEKKFNSKAKGLCFNNQIAINANIKTSREKKCILAEELGHYHTTCGDIINQNDIRNRKQELIARRWAYRKLVGIPSLIQAYKDNIHGKHELAEYLNVTEEFIEESIEYYKKRYGLFYSTDEYIIYFEPLGVLEKFCDF